MTYIVNDTSADTTSHPNQRALSLLLVDDHAVVRAGYRRLLQSNPQYQVRWEASSAEQAYQQMLDAERAGLALPDLAIVDVSLGGRSGLDLIDRITRRFAQIRCVVFSMHQSSALIDQALNAGAVGYVCKASPPETMFEALKAVLRGERYLDPELPSLTHDGAPTLTLREHEILSQLMRGMAVDDIARSLSISPKTIANHLTQIRSKLGVDNDVQLAIKAQSLGVLADGATPW